MPQSQYQLQVLRSETETKIAEHEKEISRLREVLTTIGKLEQLLSEPKQTTIDEINPYESMGPSEIVQAVVESSAREWSIADILKAASKGGYKLESNRKAYPSFYTAAKRLADKGVIVLLKRRSGETVFMRSTPVTPLPLVMQRSGVSPVSVAPAPAKKVDRFHPEKKVSEYAAEALSDKKEPMGLRDLVGEIRRRGGTISNEGTLRTLLKREPNRFMKTDDRRWRLIGPDDEDWG